MIINIRLTIEVVIWVVHLLSKLIKFVSPVLGKSIFFVRIHIFVIPSFISKIVEISAKYSISYYKMSFTFDCFNTFKAQYCHRYWSGIKPISAFRKIQKLACHDDT